MVERVNRTIKEGIAKQIAQHQNKWTEALPTVLTILRATPSRATGLSPYELMTGRLMRLPIDPEVPSSDLGPLVLAKQQVVLEQLRERLKILHAQAALKQQQADMRNDAQFNPTSEIKFTEGDMVMVRVFVKQDAFAPRWHGPYEVKAVCHSCIAVAIRGKLSPPLHTTQRLIRPLQHTLQPTQHLVSASPVLPTGNPMTLGIRRKPGGKLSMTPREDILKCPPMGQRGEL
ncbi:hypothetical protein SKAU_G00120210 [Synaphobranchus kaupii]|uniref:Integrase catalytic domain-containing protein n=1 Tax=Synaphobranchus kaupii TaxID=118154 RepID=A0A9Q1IJ52_SYNKA|nr:hypothetical protein SKAU_G00336900 [Synaphobranchus kaupii]KAJ8363190.1 hypothetical protein SKAU_G00120210 [Synaphobranchus kaupii]